jgi:hypothetical protein
MTILAGRCQLQFNGKTSSSISTCSFMAILAVPLQYCSSMALPLVPRQMRFHGYTCSFITIHQCRPMTIATPAVPYKSYIRTILL